MTDTNADTTTDADAETTDVTTTADSPPTRALVAGPDPDGVADALEAEGLLVSRLEAPLTRPTLEEAGVLDADIYVLTDVTEATTIPIVCDLTDDIRTVVYDRNTVPEFVRGQLDLAVDPRLVDVRMLAESLTAA